ncbi:putative flagellar synthesis; flagellar regulon; hook-associated protein [Marinomonas sp. MED121]|uniref:flagellar hook-associated protein FlgL n=1 Tax=Marinomonas sp. MED121 TaxID=314277 RepID=UPI00006903AC|nr:flagellar hook-associated protein FlgL [Marinomonas sp. MED121]EAQ66413.1 putative flagellar synthesis; flagellar regulon; hook-associated protein [Marinomonas sp. MED121]
MRVSNNFIYDQSLTDLTKSNERYLHTQRRIAENTDIMKASDDPVGAAQVMRYEAVNLLLDQYSENAVMAKNSLEYEEVVLDGITDIFNRANILLIQAENGAYGDDDLGAIAEELQMLTLAAADLMNSTDSSGNHIFSGHESTRTAFELKPDGRYEFAGDEGRKKLQISDNVTVSGADSGKTVFEDVWTRNNFSYLPLVGEADVRTEVADQDVYDDFLQKNYSAIDSTQNVFAFTTVAGAGLGDTFALTNSAGEVVASGPFEAGKPIDMFGMRLTIEGAAGTTGVISFDKPERDNVLNEMNKTLKVLLNPETGFYERKAALRDASVSVRNTMNSVDTARSEVGANLNTIAQVGSYGEMKSISNRVAQDEIAGLDIAEAASELAQEEAAISSSQKLFNRLSNLSLFDSM